MHAVGSRGLGPGPLPPRLDVWTRPRQGPARIREHPASGLGVGAVPNQGPSCQNPKSWFGQKGHSPWRGLNSAVLNAAVSSCEGTWLQASERSSCKRRPPELLGHPALAFWMLADFSQYFVQSSSSPLCPSQGMWSGAPGPPLPGVGHAWSRWLLRVSQKALKDGMADGIGPKSDAASNH